MPTITLYRSGNEIKFKHVEAGLDIMGYSLHMCGSSAALSLVPNYPGGWSVRWPTKNRRWDGQGSNKVDCIRLEGVVVVPYRITTMTGALCKFTTTLETTIRLFENEDVTSEVYGIYGPEGDRVTFAVTWEHVIDETVIKVI